jgi:adenylate cyclase
MTDDRKLLHWILTDGRTMSTSRFVNALCQRLIEAGLPLWRVTVYAGTLHPQIRGFGWRWRRDMPIAEELRIVQGIELTDEFLSSPLRRTIEKGIELRQRLEGITSEFPLLREFAREGCTDYLAAPLNEVRERYSVVAWASNRAGGFSDADLALLEAVRPALAAVIETVVVSRMARGLFSIYHGSHVGERVFDGQILRGHLEPLRAVIMATDLRDFTRISDQLPPDVVIEALDEFFEYVTDSVHARGGHVLKFIGDGALAIFGTEGGYDSAAANAALEAARNIVSKLAGRHTGKEPDLRAGIGLHIGTVMYGNVGGTTRLDFTAIGPAVNLAFRLQDLTKTLHRPVIASSAFAKAAGESLTPLGPQQIRGLADLEEVYGLPEHSNLPWARP